MKFEVEEDLVQPIIKEKIAAAVVSQLGDTTKLIEEMVKRALEVKVDGDGKVSNYSSYNKFTIIEAMARKTLQDAAKEAVQRIVEEQKPAITKAVQDYLKKAPKKTAASIVNAFCESAQNNYHLKVDFQVSGKDY